MEKYIVTSRYRDTSTKCYRAFVADKSQRSDGDDVVTIDKTILAKNIDEARDLVIQSSKWMIESHVPNYKNKGWFKRMFVNSIPDSCVKYELEEDGLASTCYCKNGSIVFVQAIKIED